MNSLRKSEKGITKLNFYSIIIFRTYGIVFIAWHLETGMLVAIKKFKESDDNEYVTWP